MFNRNNMRLLCLMACCISACLANKQAEYVKSVDTAEAQAAALTNSAGAAASSAKLDGADWYALDRYGWEIGKPLLVKPFGPLENLYAAALPPRSFVAEIDPAFQHSKHAGSYGDKTVTLHTGSKLAVAAI